MDPSSLVLTVFAALEIKAGETAHQVIEAFMKASVAKSYSFGGLDLLGVLPLGRVKYARFRTDATNILGILTDRNTIIFESKSLEGKYAVVNPTGRTLGYVSCFGMQSQGDLSIHRKYRGPGLQYWERQFL